jgi:hypothetical protein
MKITAIFYPDQAQADSGKGGQAIREVMARPAEIDVSGVRSCQDPAHVDLAPYFGSSFSQSWTPPWREQVPDLCWLDEYVPSLHRALAPAGATAATTGRSTQLPLTFT